MKNYIIIFILIFIISINLSAKDKNKQIDSLETILKNHKKEDTIKVILLNKIANKLFRLDKEKLLKYVEEANELSEKLNFSKGKAESSYIIGKYYYFTSDYPKAIEFYKKSLEINKKLGNKIRVSACFNNIGIIHNNKGDYEKAIEFYKKSLEIDKEIGDEKGVAMSLNNIGLIFLKNSNFSKALDYFQKSLTIKEKFGNKVSISRCLNNIGLIYNSNKNYEKALEYFQKSLKMKEGFNDKYGSALCLNNIGLIYKEQNKTEKALEYHHKSLKIKKELKDKSGIASTYGNIGSIYYEKKDYKKALKFLLKGLEISKKINLLDNQKKIYGHLAYIYFKTKNYKKAYESQIVYKKLNDSIFNENNIKKITGLEYKYQHEKEKEILKLEQEKKNTIYAKEIKHQKTIKNFFIIGLSLMIIFVFVIFYSFLQKRKANRILSEQKQKIIEINGKLNQTNEELNQTNEELNTTLETINEQKEKIEISHIKIKNSINYASRIQNAILPSLDLFKNNVSDYFIFFKPRDIVSGDFYWAKKINEYFIIATADCTGHGVPGAFVSMLGISLLNEIVRKKDIIKASHVLDLLREEIKISFRQEEKNNKDGMDLALYVINTKTNELQFSGANNPLYLFRNKELIEFKNDKQPIGIYRKEKPFTNYEFQLQKNDVLYTFSDGYIDQFGGEKGKKFMRKQFKRLLSEIHHKDMSEQNKILNDVFEKWKGYKYKQIDDTLVVGVKI